MAEFLFVDICRAICRYIYKVKDEHYLVYTKENRYQRIQETRKMVSLIQRKHLGTMPSTSPQLGLN
jgi:hypothetical protein